MSELIYLANIGEEGLYQIKLEQVIEHKKTTVTLDICGNKYIQMNIFIITRNYE